MSDVTAAASHTADSGPDAAVLGEAAAPSDNASRSAGGGRTAWARAELADRERLRRGYLFVACFGAVFIALLVRNHQVLQHVYREDGDFAVNSLSVDRAVHFHQLVGNYSRVGFHHPGPAYFYLLAAGQWLFYSALHVVPGPFNGQMMIAFAMTSWFVAMTASLVARATKSTAAGAVAASVVFAVAAPVNAFGHMWLPFLYMPMFGLLVVSAALLASGRLFALPSFVIAGGFLIQGHVSFVSTVGATSVFVLAADWLPRRGRLRPAARRHRRQLVLCLLWVLLFATPMVIQVALHYPGPWVDYWDYSRNSKTHSISKSAAFFGWYWRKIGVTWWLFALAAVVGVALLLTERRRERRDLVLWLYAVAALESAIFFFYVLKGVDSLAPAIHYVGFYYLMVPTLLLATVAVHAVSRLAEAVRFATPVALVAAAGLFCGLAPAASVVDPQQGQHPDYADAARAMESLPGRDGRPVELESRAWPKLAAVIVASHRIGDQVCVGNRLQNWTRLFEDGDICHSYKGMFGVELVPVENLRGRTALWSDSSLALLAYHKN